MTAGSGGPTTALRAVTRIARRCERRIGAVLGLPRLPNERLRRVSWDDAVAYIEHPSHTLGRQASPHSPPPQAP
jgi:hypothetical protein